MESYPYKNYKIVDADQLDAGLTSVADAIRKKGNTTETLDFPVGFIDAIGSLGSAGGSVSEKDVNFYDYDGTLLHSYTVAEAQALSELPALPEQPGLVCQGWNYDLETIKAYNRPVNAGATYITDDGATRLNIRIATDVRMTVPLYFSQTVADGVNIDWGDGSSLETLAGTGYVNTSHTYAEPGDYVISLMPSDSCELSIGENYSGYCVLGERGATNAAYRSMLQTAYIGKNVTTIGNYAFSDCYSLASVTIPNGVTSIGIYVFPNCYSLASVTIPNGVTSIGTYAFQNCHSLASITIPNGVASIGTYAFSDCYSLASVTIPNGLAVIENYIFQNCYSLASVTIPNGVTSIRFGVFKNCYSLASITIPNGVTSIMSGVFLSCYAMKYCDFTSCASVPTLSKVDAFSGIPADCQILVPAALYDEWIAATNWATYASYIKAV